MNTHNQLGNRPLDSEASKGEVVRPQASEFETLKQLIKQLKDVEVEDDKEDIIIIRRWNLRIGLEKWNDEGNYWVYIIRAEDGNDKAEIYISTLEQTFSLIAYPKNQKVEVNYKIRNERVEEDLFICTKSEFAIDEIRDILQKCEDYGVLGGLYEYFKKEFLDTIL
jgi:hypothetical protein